MDDVHGVFAGSVINEVVRVGDTVRRRALVPMDRSFSEAVLRSLTAAGYEAAPGFLGHDDEGRRHRFRPGRSLPLAGR